LIFHATTVDEKCFVPVACLIDLFFEERGFMIRYWLFCISCVFSVCVSTEVERVVVYVDIVGDLFHAGHVRFLEQAKTFGNYLIVGVLEDDVVEEYKRRPVVSLEDRAKVIAACRSVDEVIIAPPLRLTEEMVAQHQISYVVHGDDFNRELLEDQYGVALRLGIFRTVPYTPGISTTQIIRNIVKRHQQGDF
jgi:cytidyltransferase-like protein